MSLAPSIRTFSYEKILTELIGSAFDNNLNACKKIIVSLSVNSQYDEFSRISNNDIFFGGKANQP